ncbi:Helicase associated domain protein [Streptomyces sp. NPDC086549]|uniref:DEAD/DEAH box helicase n=1 Tax=Streptomyces sp. NPDC086549 TaxID=3365752 RepID=UPI0038188F4D
MPIQLREHQVDANSRVLKWTGFPARSPVPAQGARATLVSATGSGKTYTAAAAALECFRGGRILVTVPTLDLLVQTAQAWRRVGHTAPMVAVCSLDNDAVLDNLEVRTTTNPIQLALWAGSGPVVVLATYASLVDREDPEDPTGRAMVRGPLEAALAGGERLYGQTMNSFDFAVVDEAHGTAGDLGRPWAAIHDQNRIPIDYRLYLTATPRILASPQPVRGAAGEELEIASMTSDPDGPYGEWIYELGLSEAIERGILAPFEIDVLEIHDPNPMREDTQASGEAARGRRLALLQTALLEHAAKHNLKTIMTFHHRVEEAAALAENLPKTAAQLYENEAVSEQALAAAEQLPPSSIDARLYELDQGRHVPPHRVWSAWLCGDHLVAERRETIRQFANGMDADGRRVHRAFLASVRVLGEGVDIVGTRGVEAICFADTRGSQVDIVQNIGRALRPNPDGTTKTARILVPVFLQPGENPTDMVASASYAPLVAVLNGLRSHSEHLVEDLASPATTSGQRKIHLQRDTDGRIIATPAGTEGEGSTDETGGGTQSALLHFSTPRDPATIAAFLRSRVYRPESRVWLEGYQALRRWRAQHHITGLHTVPYDTEVTVGITDTFPLGRWVHQQRKARRTGDLDTHRIKQLDAEGMVWEPGEEAWENRLAVLRSYHHAHGHLAPRQDAQWEGPDPDGPDGTSIPIGQLIANLRRPHGLGKNPERAAARAAQLTAIDPDWNCPWPLDWQRLYHILTALAADERAGRLPDIAPGVTFEGDDLGKWLIQQRRNWVELSEEQQQRLSALGVAPAERTVPAPKGARKATGKTSAAFQRGLAALAQWVKREGAHRPVPRGHSEQIAVDGEPVIVKLGVWVSNTRARRDKLTHEQQAALAALGVPWARAAAVPAGR